MDFDCVKGKTTAYDLSFQATVGTAATFVCFDNVRMDVGRAVCAVFVCGSLDISHFLL